MKRRKHRERGSITVFVTAMLIPIVFFSGMLTDIARIKMYNTQAMMTADNYAEAVLSQYDDLLKDLYGLFAVSQDEEGKKAVELLQKYMCTSFDPNKEGKESYTGLMAYKSAELDIDYKPIEGANLGNKNVLGTQLGDFMKFRIVQNLIPKNGKEEEDDDGSEEQEESGTWMVDAVDQIQNSKADTDVLAAKDKRDKKLKKLLDAMEKYTNQLCKLDKFKESYLKKLYKAEEEAEKEFKKIEKSQEYKEYMKKAEKEADSSSSGNSDSQKKDSVNGGQDEADDLETQGKYFDEKISKIIEKFDDCYHEGKHNGTDPIAFDNYDKEVSTLEKYAEDVKKGLKKVRAEQKKFEEKLNEENVSEDLKNGIIEEDKSLNELLNSSSSLGSEDTYSNIVSVFENNSYTVKEVFGSGTAEYREALEERRSYDLRYWLENPDYPEPEFPDKISIDDYTDFKKSYGTLYNSLKKSFSSESDKEDNKKKANDKQTECENKTDEIRNQMEKDGEEEEKEAKKLQNIPKSVPIGDDEKAALIKLDDVLGTASDFMNKNMDDKNTNPIWKLYVANYDLGMFSNRTSADGDLSLTGYPIGEDINYLYLAELEYIYGGHRNSAENWKEARNSIILFRTVSNYISTYTISEINTVIRSVSTSVSTFTANPLIGAAVSAALRMAVATIETYSDWDLLKKGEKVCLIKMQFSDLSSKEEMMSWLNSFSQSITDMCSESEGDRSKTNVSKDENKVNLNKDGNKVNLSKDGNKVDLNKDKEIEKTAGKKGSFLSSIKLNYRQYLMVLIFALVMEDHMIERTGDLISLNINNVKQGRDFTSLSFKMEEAVTSVDASCSVHLNYILMPDGFAKSTMKDTNYSSWKEFEKNTYKYSIIRGY